VQGQRVPFTAKARWSEYHQDKSPMWSKMPYLMLGKCAEALALRKAFPAELSNVYTQEEMDQADYVEATVRETPHQHTHAAPAPRAIPAPKPTLDDLKREMKRLFEAQGLTTDTMTAWFNAHQMNSRTYTHVEKVVAMLKDDHQAALLHLHQFGMGMGLVNAESVLAVMRRLLHNPDLIPYEAWVMVGQNPEDWAQDIKNELAAAKASA
jgi:hypothetical protein